ncbi:MAG: hypothetical protein IKC10_07825 [Alphaproteobacteria bacterium]|nr:hypothetical protein [Alphaproteobacteria bacterium]
MVGTITPNYIKIRQGDNFTVLFQFKDENKFIDISGSTLKMYVKNKADNKTVLIKQGVVDDGINGKAHIAILPEDTIKLNINNEYITDVQITFGNGETHTIYPQNLSQVASFIITQHVTE